jgi:hypothetical protein
MYGVDGKSFNGALHLYDENKLNGTFFFLPFPKKGLKNFSS